MKNQKLFKLFVLMAASVLAIAILSSCSVGSMKNDMEIDHIEENFDADKGSDVDSGNTYPSTSGRGEVTEDSATDGSSDEYEPKIIQTVEINAETKDFNNAVKDIEEKIKSLGGYIEDCNVKNSSYSGKTSIRHAYYTLRVPADKLETFLGEAGKLINITSSSRNAKDVSGDYYDIEARLSVLETERGVLQKMLSEADSVDNMITLERRLYDVIYEIESYKTQLKVYDGKVAYATVRLNLDEVASLTPVTVDNSFGTRFKSAVSESWQNTVDFSKDLVIFLVYAAPVVIIMLGGAVVVGGVIAAVALIVVKIRKAHRNKKAEL